MWTTRCKSIVYFFKSKISRLISLGNGMEKIWFINHFYTTTEKDYKLKSFFNIQRILYSSFCTICCCYRYYVIFKNCLFYEYFHLDQVCSPCLKILFLYENAWKKNKLELFILWFRFHLIIYSNEKISFNSLLTLHMEILTVGKHQSQQPSIKGDDMTNSSFWPNFFLYTNRTKRTERLITCTRCTN
jgi:hypothetical protein